MELSHSESRSNVAYPGVLRELACQLGVSVASLHMLQIGYSLDDRAWMCPEFDAKGKLIGLVRRYESGKKCCVTGSKRGLAMNPNAKLTSQPIIIVEGHSDAAAALSIGCRVLGRPSATSGFDLLVDATVDQDVLVVGENDGGVGITSLPALVERLEARCKSISSILPLEGLKDLREWVANGLTREILEDLADGGTVSGTQLITLSSSEVRGIDLVENWLRATYWQGGKDGIPLLRSSRQDWYLFRSAYYEPVNLDVDMIASLHNFFQKTSITRLTPKGIQMMQYDLTPTRLRQMLQALMPFCAVSQIPPCWLDGRTTPRMSNIVFFENGYLDTGTWQFFSPSPSLFTIATVPYAYDPDAACPRWEQFLQEIFPDAADKIDLLQEWLGYLLTPDTQHEKYMLFIGPSGGGKSTAIDAIMSVLGPSYTAAMSLFDLASSFGLQKLVGKHAAFASDVHVTKNTDAFRVVEILKAITGQDSLAVNRKFRDEITLRLKVRLTLAANELPELPDDALALRRRMLILQFAESFVDNPDPSLKVTLGHEAPGICVWALEGLKRLQRQQKFTEPASMPQIMREMDRVNSPIRAFIDECCIIKTEGSVPLQALFDCWRGFQREQRGAINLISRFEHRIRTAIPGLQLEAVGDIVMYRGISLRPEAEVRYLRL